MLKNIKKSVFFLSFFLLPVLALAQPSDKFIETNKLLFGILNIVRDILIPLVFTLALLFFFYGVAKYIWSEDKSKGKEIMTWGVVALFVMTSIWGIIYFIQDEVGINNTIVPTGIPNVSR